MADYHDWADARHEADDARGNARTYGSRIEDGNTPDPGLAVLLAAEAICAELRALGARLDYLGRELDARQERRGR